MTVITDSAVVPARIHALVRHLQRRGPVEHDDLLRTFSPTTLRSERGRKDVHDCLTEGQRLGIFERRDAGWSLTGQVSNGGELVAVLERAIIAPRGTDGPQVTDPARAIAWFLTRDPYRPADAGKNWHTIVAADCPDEQEGAFGLSNETRSTQFAHWATYLGFGWRLPAKLVPDPTAALERHLKLVLPAGVPIQIGESIDLLAASCPVLERGSARSNVEAALIPERRRLPARLSRSTTFALLRLEARGVVALPPPPADAAVIALDIPHQHRTVSHIVLEES